MEKKNVVFLTIIAVATLLTAVIGATFAYFSVSVGGTGNTSNNESQVTTAVVAGVDYEGTSVAETPDGGIYPGWNGIQSFTISAPDGAPANGKGTYTVTLTPNVHADFGTDVTYKVYKTTDATKTITVTEGTLTNTTDATNQYQSNVSKEDTVVMSTEWGTNIEATPVQNTMADGYVTGGTLTGTTSITLDTVSYTTPFDAITYYIVYDYVNRDASQNDAMGDTFSAVVNVTVAVQ